MGKSKPLLNAKHLKTVRNVLVQPFKTEWPTILPNEEEKLLELLKQIPNGEIVHGTNPVNQLLSNGEACVLLISSDFHPQILGKQIIQMARRWSTAIQILAVQNLAWNGKPEKLIAIRKSVDQCPERLSQLIDLMKDLSLTKGYNTKSIVLLSDGNENQGKKPTKVENISQEEIQELYLARPTSGKRAFVPPVSNLANEKSTDVNNEEWGPIISLKRSKSEEEDKRIKHKKKATSFTFKSEKASGSYVSLTVNRVQGNPNRKAEKRRKK